MAPSEQEDGQIYDVTEVPELSKNTNTISTLWWTVDQGWRSPRPFDSAGDRPSNHLEGCVIIDVIGGQELRFNERFCLPAWRFPDGRVRVRLFLLQCAFGASARCDGLGSRLVARGRGLAIPDENSPEEGSFCRLELISSNYYMSMMRQFCEQEGDSMIFLIRSLKSPSKQTLRVKTDAASNSPTPQCRETARGRSIRFSVITQYGTPLQRYGFRLYPRKSCASTCRAYLAQ